MAVQVQQSGNAGAQAPQSAITPSTIVQLPLLDGGSVVVIELNEQAMAWTTGHPAASRIAAVTDDAAEEAVVALAADAAEAASRLTG